MHFTKTTIRALAASAVLVAAGSTVAGAAAFHLPILGFGAAPASASPTPASVKPAAPAARRAVRPRKIVKTRYVDDIVHRPAAVSASPSRAAVGTAPTVAPMTASTSVPPPTVTIDPSTTSTTAPTVAPPTTTPETPTTQWSDDGHDGTHHHTDDSQPEQDR